MVDETPPVDQSADESSDGPQMAQFLRSMGEGPHIEQGSDSLSCSDGVEVSAGIEQGEGISQKVDQIPLVIAGPRSWKKAAFPGDDSRLDSPAFIRKFTQLSG